MIKQSVNLEKRILITNDQTD